MSKTSNRKIYVVGVGLTKFVKPGGSRDYPELAAEAVNKALIDARLSYTDIQFAAASYVYGDSTCGQRSLYQLGLTGIPIVNVNNNCSSGSSGLYLAAKMVEKGAFDCALAVGFEKMEPGSLGSYFMDRTNPLDHFFEVVQKHNKFQDGPGAPILFASGGLEHMEKYGTKAEHFALVAEKNHRHSQHNPYAQFKIPFTLEQIKASPVVAKPLTKLQCCPTSDGAGAVIVCSEEFVKKRGLQSQAVEIASIVLKTDMQSAFSTGCIEMLGSEMAEKAAQEALKEAKITINDVQVVELHDCFSVNELLTYEALGLCKRGEGGKLIESGNATYGGKYVVNPSGGLLSKGHPLGATGLAQCSELVWQLRQMTGARQVKNVKYALQHNLGLGGAVVIAVYKLGFPDQFKPLPPNAPNPAVDATVHTAPSKL